MAFLILNALIGSNQLITSIPNHEDIFNYDNIEEQNCTAMSQFLKNMSFVKVKLFGL